LGSFSYEVGISREFRQMKQVVLYTAFALALFGVLYLMANVSWWYSVLAVGLLVWVDDLARKRK
jgi:hypothetical protein